MRARTMSIGGIVALVVIAGVLFLSRVGFRQCGQWMVSTAVGFFTQQDVAPETGIWSEPEPARASELPPSDKAQETGESQKPDTSVLQLAKVENKKETAETGLKVISGGAQDILDSSEDGRAAATSPEPESAPERVRETQGAIVAALNGLKGEFQDSPDPGTGAEKQGGGEGPSRTRDSAPTAVESPAAALPLSAPSPDALRSKYAYSSGGRRDPFRALVSEGEEDADSSVLDLDGARLVGILWGGRSNIALLEDSQRMSFCLREGDRVEDGRLATIRSNSVVFSRFRFGRTETVVLELEEKKAGGS